MNPISCKRGLRDYHDFCTNFENPCNDVDKKKLTPSPAGRCNICITPSQSEGFRLEKATR